jgi:hypothetical protein
MLDFARSAFEARCRAAPLSGNAQLISVLNENARFPVEPSLGLSTLGG